MSLKLNDTNLSHFEYIDTNYPVFSVTGAAGDGCCFFHNTENNTFWISFDGPYGADSSVFNLVYNVWDDVNKTITDRIEIGYFEEHQESYGRVTKGYTKLLYREKKFGYRSLFYRYFKGIYFSKSPKLLPEIKLDYSTASIDNPFGRSVFFINKVKITSGFTQGPYRIYDKRYNRLTGVIAFVCTDNFYKYSGAFDISYGVNSSGKLPSINNIIYPKTYLWSIGNNLQEDSGGPLSAYPGTNRFGDVARQVLDNNIDYRLVVLYYNTTKGIYTLNDRLFSPKRRKYA